MAVGAGIGVRVGKGVCVGGGVGESAGVEVGVGDGVLAVAVAVLMGKGVSVGPAVPVAVGARVALIPVSPAVATVITAAATIVGTAGVGDGGVIVEQAGKRQANQNSPTRITFRKFLENHCILSLLTSRHQSRVITRPETSCRQITPPAPFTGRFLTSPAIASPGGSPNHCRDA